MVSESFTNNAAGGTLTANGSGVTSSSAARSTLTISYDAASNSYEVAANGRSQSFAPTSRDAGLSNSTIDVFVKTAGNTTDSLTLTRPSADGGGSLNYQYVGGGVWQRTTNGAAITGSVESFAYGVVTPAGSIPRAGSASFRVDLLGITAFPDGVSALSGTGAVTLDFATSAFSGLGDAQETLVSGVPGAARSGPWSLTGTLGTSNALSGTFKLFTGSYNIEGPLDGRLFGPQADEIGAAFALSGAKESGQGSVSGLLIGRRQVGESTGFNPNLINPQFDELFTFTPKSYRLEIDPGTGEVIRRVNGFAGNINGLLYHAADRSFDAKATGGDVRFSPAQLVAAESNDRTDVYRSISGDTTNTLLLFKPGPGNSEVVLTYTSFGSFSRIAPSGIGATTFADRNWFAFGIQTSASAMPTTGQASYSATLRGDAYGAEASAAQFTVEGTAKFTFTFAFTGGVSGTVNPVVIDGNGTRTVLDPLTMTSSIGAIMGSSFNANLGNNGQIGGRFFGPNAEEIGGAFSTLFAPPGSNGLSGMMVGGFAGTKCATTC